eukprot:TRINITY_DN5425_c0_g1_i1.p4 TRINITY_DN5425_c0_g1~~TRINITY_DN5425_c0_g1_i1.p4  ORF type:complete len:129 (+),score=3.96 TRINITY_DN5425_c0_g1_i1:511-897(+)
MFVTYFLLTLILLIKKSNEEDVFCLSFLMTINYYQQHYNFFWDFICSYDTLKIIQQYQSKVASLNGICLASVCLVERKIPMLHFESCIINKQIRGFFFKFFFNKRFLSVSKRLFTLGKFFEFIKNCIP